MAIPKEFTERMRLILGDSYPDFEKALDEPPVRGIRVNGLKVGVKDFVREFDRELESLDYTRDGFIPKNADGIGNTPEHHSGMIYVQDPGAMAPVNAVDIPCGARVLDTCAAPGGKSLQLAAAIGDGGFLLANEYVPKRAKIIVGNFERLGVRNAVVTSLDTAELGGYFEEYFDVLLCDAPCSGEGMFRKCEDALLDWSMENVRLCAKRQREILENTIGTLKGGGTLIYSTCTYSVEENEEVVLATLKAHPELELIEVKEELRKVTSDGIVIDGHEQLKLCRRFYPHISRGEGQFVAVMKKRDNNADSQRILYKSNEKSPDKQEMAVIRDFVKSNLIHDIDARLTKQGNGISCLPFPISVPPAHTFMAGVMLGEIKGKLLFPHHQFFMAYGELFARRRELFGEDVERYLRGEEIDADGLADGWCAVFYRGAAIGGGKVSGGRMKNHYPKGLRIK